MLKFKIFKKIGSIIPIPIFRKLLEFIKHYFVGLLKRIDEHNLFFAGAGISYSLFLGMIPLILLVFSLLSNIFDVKTLQEQIFQIIDTVIPYPVYASYMKKVIETRLPEFVGYGSIAGYIGGIGLLTTSTWIFSSMRTILNQIFHTKIQKSAVIGLLRDLGMVILLVIFITLSTFVFPIVSLILEVAKTSEMLSAFNVSELWNSVVWISSLIIMLGMFFLLYYLIPYEKLPKRVALISAFWTTLLWEGARNIFGYYIQHFFSSNALYGAFALIVVILLWVFYSSCIFIVGAEIGQLFRERLIQKKKKNEAAS
ncbi:MAG: YihY/virulence factor BrkB family protein [Melioribacteraceae bacterium]|nr:YihY/virulence factor BrkB family protein [Melioribacteraceae bacterium]